MILCKAKVRNMSEIIDGFKNAIVMLLNATTLYIEMYFYMADQKESNEF